MKIILILLLIFLLILSLPLLAQASGNLYLKNVNGKFGWFKTGNDKIDWTYVGEIKNGKPNGSGVLSTTFGKYSGEFKNGMMDGQGIFTNNSGIKTVGEFRKSKPWVVKKYDKSGIIEAEWFQGVKSKKVGNELGLLYLKNVNSKFGWFENGNANKDWTYVGEIKNGKPNGNGVLRTTFGKYSGEFKNGMMDGKGTFTNNSGIKTVGEFRKSKPWNVKNYDKSGKIEPEWIKGVKSKKEKVPPPELKEFSEKWTYKIGFRLISGNTFAIPNTSNNSLSLSWENYGLGFNQMSFNDITSSNNVLEMENSSIDLSYKIGEKWILIAGTGYVYGGKGSITSGSSAVNYETESVSGFGLFGLFGVVWEDIEGLIGLRYYNINYTDFNSTNSSEVFSLGKPYSIVSAQLIFGLGYSF